MSLERTRILKVALVASRQKPTFPNEESCKTVASSLRTPACGLVSTQQQSGAAASEPGSGPCSTRAFKVSLPATARPTTRAAHRECATCAARRARPRPRHKARPSLRREQEAVRFHQTCPLRRKRVVSSEGGTRTSRGRRYAKARRFEQAHAPNAARPTPLRPRLSRPSIRVSLRCGCVVGCG